MNGKAEERVMSVPPDLRGVLVMLWGRWFGISYGLILANDMLGLSRIKLHSNDMHLPLPQKWPY